MAQIAFTKMEGLGNDYVYVDTALYPVADPSALAVSVSDRHRGIGADGLVLIGRSGQADFSMRIFNADGSQAQMCGNATRCIGLYVHEKGLTDKTDISLETLSGIKHIRLHMDADGQVGAVSVDMGPFRCAETLQEVSAAGRTFAGRIVDVGNPHFVVFADEGAQAQIDRFGPGIEHAPLFPRRTNVEFARLTAPGHIRMRVWERGSGITMACGTGACATAVAARKAGLTGDRCTVEMDGGSLEIGIGADGHIRMTGGARIVFEGTIHV